MNKLLFDKLPEDFQVLYTLSKKKKLNSELQRILQQAVGQTKRRMAINTIDELREKLASYGNGGTWARVTMQRLQRAVFESKSPGEHDLGQWLSIEIECILPAKSAEKTFISLVKAKGYAKAIAIKDDGSVHPKHYEECITNEDSDSDCDCGKSDAYGREIVVTFKYGQWAIVKDVCEALKEVGATVNDTCGLHVHFDCRDLSALQVTHRGKRIAACVPALKQLLPKSRQDNQYCAHTINKHRGGSRYAFVNLQSYRKHQTLEIRGHSGTTDAAKIINWIELLRIIMLKRGKKGANTVPNLLTNYALPEALQAYVVARYTKFNQSAKQADVLDDVSRDNVLVAMLPF